jgi:hypothetical protein
MPLVTTTYPIKLSNIKTGFGGGTPPANLRSYLAGGSYVPANSAYLTVANAGAFIPTSGTVKITDFRSASYPTIADIDSISANSWTVTDEIPLGTAISGSCSLSITNQGVTSFPQDTYDGLGPFNVAADTISGNWLATDVGISTTTSTAIASLFEVSFTKTAGVLTLSGTTSGTWYALSSNRQFTVSDNVSSTGAGASRSRGITGTVSIRRADTLAVVATTTVSLTVNLVIYI